MLIKLSKETVGNAVMIGQIGGPHVIGQIKANEDALTLNAMKHTHFYDHKELLRPQSF